MEIFLDTLKQTCNEISVCRPGVDNVESVYNSLIVFEKYNNRGLFIGTTALSNTNSALSETNAKLSQLVNLLTQKNQD